MYYRPLGKSGRPASIVGLGAWVLGGGQIWGRDTDDAESVRTIQATLDLGINLIDTAPAYGWGRSEHVVGRALAGTIGMDRVFQPTEFRSNTWWNNWLMPANRRRVLDLLASWRELTDKYGCTLSQLVIVWTATQTGVTHVLAGARNLAQIAENAKAGDLTLEPADRDRIRRDVIALGETRKI